MADTVRTEGLDLVLRNLRKVRREAPTAFAVIQQEVAAPIVSAARRKARKRSGRMASTVRVAPVRVISDEPVDWVIAGEGTEYTGVQHGGWAAHGISPNPFLTDAVDQGADAALDDYDRRVGVFLERTWVNS